MNSALIIFLILHAVTIQVFHLALLRMGKVALPPIWSFIYSLFVYFFLIPPIIFVLVDDLTGLTGAQPAYLFLIIPSVIISAVVFFLSRGKRK